MNDEDRDDEEASKKLLTKEQRLKRVEKQKLKKNLLEQKTLVKLCK